MFIRPWKRAKQIFQIQGAQVPVPATPYSYSLWILRTMLSLLSFVPKARVPRWSEERLRFSSWCKKTKDDLEHLPHVLGQNNQHNQPNQLINQYTAGEMTNPDWVTLHAHTQLSWARAEQLQVSSQLQIRWHLSGSQQRPFHRARRFWSMFIVFALVGEFTRRLLRRFCKLCSPNPLLWAIRPQEKPLHADLSGLMASKVPPIF